MSDNIEAQVTAEFELRCGAQGTVWLDHQDDAIGLINLGDIASAHEALCRFLAEIDFGTYRQLKPRLTEARTSPLRIMAWSRKTGHRRSKHIRY